MSRKGYPAEFRRRALELVAAGKSVAEVARLLEVGDQSFFLGLLPTNPSRCYPGSRSPFPHVADRGRDRDSRAEPAELRRHSRARVTAVLAQQSHSVEELLGGRVSRFSVSDYLRTRSNSPRPLFVRRRRGHYRLLHDANDSCQPGDGVALRSALRLDTGGSIEWRTPARAQLIYRRSRQPVCDALA
jgi:hypothetical protein